MAMSEFEVKRCERELEKFLSVHRPPVHVRNELDISYRLINQSVEIFEVTPDWKDPTEKMETPVAKGTYVKSQNIWKVYWHKSDMKWHRYDPMPEVKSIEDFLTTVGEDKHCCFFG
ncbi:MAG: hypothetical protein ACI89D_002769 [Bermanella sp.]|jgi:hypothetical protein